MRKETYTKGDFSKVSTKALFTGVKTKKQVLESVARSIEIEPINKFAALAVTEWSVVEIKEFLDGILGSDGSGHPEPVISWEDIAQESGYGCGAGCDDGTGGICGAGCDGGDGCGCGGVCNNATGKNLAIDILGSVSFKKNDLQEIYKAGIANKLEGPLIQTIEIAQNSLF